MADINDSSSTDMIMMVDDNGYDLLAYTDEEPTEGKIANSGGGFSFVVDDFCRLRRFLCLGTEGGTYYIGEAKLNTENADVILRLINRLQGVKVVKELLTMSVNGRASKQNSILFALAMCARLGDVETRRLAYFHLSDICRIPTHLFTFIGYAETMTLGQHRGTGWGRVQRRALCNWYNTKTPVHLSGLVTKYKNREGWSHLDLFRLCHLKSTDISHDLLYKYIVKGWSTVKDADITWAVTDDVAKTFKFLQAVEEAKTADEARIVELITEHMLVREHIPTTLLSSVRVWDALLVNMPLTALLRNLAKMTSVGLFSEGRDLSSNFVCEQLTNPFLLKKARIHPFNVLIASKTYESGHGDKGGGTWIPVQKIVTALSKAYDLAFAYAEPTNKRFVLAMDISGSMQSGCINGCRLITPREGAAAMAMCTLRTEPNCTSVAFCSTLVPYPMTAAMSLSEQTQLSQEWSHRMGQTDCAQPMVWALANRIEADVFIIYTDCETNVGRISPASALKQYRAEMGIPAKIIVVAMTSNGFTIADPADSGMLDIAGFDSAAPEVISNFVLGNI